MHVTLFWYTHFLTPVFTSRHSIPEEWLFSVRHSRPSQLCRQTNGQSAEISKRCVTKHNLQGKRGNGPIVNISTTTTVTVNTAHTVHLALCLILTTHLLFPLTEWTGWCRHRKSVFSVRYRVIESNLAQV